VTRVVTPFHKTSKLKMTKEEEDKMDALRTHLEEQTKKLAGMFDEDRLIVKINNPIESIAVSFTVDADIEEEGFMEELEKI
jgi:hypothetical protein